MKPRLFSLAFLTALVAAAAAIAWLSTRRAQAADTARIALAEKRQQLTEELRRAGSRRRTAENTCAELSARLAALAKSPSPKPPPTVPPPIQLTQDDPTLQILQLAARRGQFAIIYGPLYRLLAFTPAQIGQFEQNLLRREERRSDLHATAHDQGLSTNDPAYQKLSGVIEREYQAAQRELLGETGVQRLRQYDRQSDLREIVSGLAGAAAAGGAPLDTAQAERLVTALDAASARFPNSDWPNPQQVDWPRVHAQAGTFLTADQLALIETTEPRGPRGMGGRFLPALHAAIAAAQAEDAKNSTVPATAPTP